MGGVNCNKCGIKLDHDHLPSDDAAHGSDGKIYCRNCASTANPAPAVTRFYFCETCGKRITDKQILEGLARDKKLKGVYCQACAVGVMTMEFDAISEADLRKPGTPGTGEFSQESRTHRKPTRSASATIKRSESRPLPPVDAPHTGSAFRIKPFAAAIAIAGSLTVLGTVALILGSPSRRNIQKESVPVALPADTVKPQPVQSSVAPSTLSPTPVPEPSPVVAALATPPVPPASSEFEDRATEAFEVLQRFDGLDNSDNTGRLERIDDFLGQYGGSIVSSGARTLRKEVALKINATPPGDSPPAPVTATATTPVQAPVIVDSAAVTQRLLQQMFPVISQMKIPAAVQLVEQNPDVPAESRNALKAALAALQKREQAWRDALGLRNNQKIHLETRKGVVDGTVLSIEGNALKVDKPLILDGAVMGSAGVIVPFADILPVSRDALAPLPEPASIDEWMGEALSHISKQEVETAEAALAHCSSHSLFKPLGDAIGVLKIEKHESNAQDLWKAIQAAIEKSPTQTTAKEAVLKLSLLEKDFADTAFVKEIKEQIVGATETANRLALGLDPKIMNRFHGKIESYDPKTQRIEIEYDFKDEAQKDDFEGTCWKGLKIEKHELVFPSYYVTPTQPRENYILHMPRFVAGDITVTMDFKSDNSLGGSWMIAVAFGLPEAQPKLPCVVTDGKHFSVISSLPYYWMDTEKGEKITVPDSPMPTTGAQLEVSCHGSTYTAKANGKTALEFTRPGTGNTNQGCCLVMGNGQVTRLKRLKIASRLDPHWMAQAVKP